MDLQHLVFLVLYSLAYGTFASLGLVKPGEVGRHYFLYHGLGTVAVAGLAYALSGAHGVEPRPWLFGFALTAGIFSVVAGPGRRYPWVFFAAALVLGGVALFADVPTPLTFRANALLSALLLGFAMAAMLLGHWYLVQPRLSIQELKRVSAVLVGLVALRFVLGTYVAWTLLAGKNEAEIYHFLLSGSPGIFVLMRWFWGLLGPLALCYLIWGTVRIRSTQSATGILYVAVLFVLTGETLSQYLALFHGMAF